MPAAVAVFAGDHGVHAQGVTPWPQEVTAQMAANFAAGGAVVNAFAAQLGADVVVVDVGVAAPSAPAPGFLDRNVRRGTADLAEGPAMTRGQARRAVEVGIAVATELAADHACLVTGDMGITTPPPRPRWSARSPAPPRPPRPVAAPGSTTPPWTARWRW